MSILDTLLHMYLIILFNPICNKKINNVKGQSILSIGLNSRVQKVLAPTKHLYN